MFYTNERRYAEAEKTHLHALAIREKVLDIRSTTSQINTITSPDVSTHLQPG